MSCPGTYGSCKCREHYGLLEYMQNLTGRTYGLEPSWTPPAAALRVIEPEHGMTCQCARCVAERVVLMSRRPARQPWEHARAA